MVLIISSKKDGHIGSVTKYFDEHTAYGYTQPIKWVRINIEDFATNLKLTIRPDSEESLIEVLDSKKSFQINEITSVWYRKPDPVNLSHFKMEEAGIEYVEAEINEVILGLYALLNDKIWINNPFTTRLSHRKLLQLQVAKNIGFEIPKTLISNDERTVLTFAESLDWDIAIKSFGAISVTTHEQNIQKQYGIWTRRLIKDELLAVKNKIQYSPTLYQQYIKKKFELRITCVGIEIFGCRIDSQENPETSEDMRFNVRSLKHQEFDCTLIKKMLHDYLNYFKINFGCFDIAVDENNKFVFFECNPNGQWLWVEQLTGMKISEAIANLLTSPASR